MRKLTLNYGASTTTSTRRSRRKSSPASTWIGARNFPAIPNLPNWNDWSVRMAAAYDLFGDGKTAVKANAGSYVGSQAAGYAQTFNGMSGATSTVPWTDLDHNGSILDANGNIEVNEVGARPSNFGQITSVPDPNLARPYNWEYSAVIQHELMPRVSVSAGYYRRDYYNIQITANENLALTDWSPYTLATPTDPRLPGSGQPLTLYTLNPAKVGVATENLVTFSTTNKTTYNGFEFSGNVRRDKLLLFGGVTTDRRASTTCDIRDNPNLLLFCSAIPAVPDDREGVGGVFLPLRHPAQWNVLFHSWTADRRELHRDVRTCRPPDHRLDGRGGVDRHQSRGARQPVPQPHQNRIDMRLGKMFRFDHYRIQGFADIFNVLNAGTTTGVNTTYGAVAATNAWMTPTQIMQGRYLRFGMQLNF